MAKILKIVLYILMLISLVFLALFYSQNSAGTFDLSNMSAIMSSVTLVDGLLYWSYALCGISIVALIVLSVMGMVENPKTLKRAGVVLGLAVILIIVSYVFASGAEVPVNIDPAPTASVFKMTDFFLVMTYILFAGSVVALIAGAVRNALNK